MCQPFHFLAFFSCRCCFFLYVVFPLLQRGLKCGPFVWVMLMCWGNECINFISTWPQSNNYQSRCVTSNHVQICQLIIKILFWGTWIWHESPREKKREEKVNAFQWPRLGACCWTQWGWLGIVDLLARFLHVDSSHSGLIRPTTNSRGLAGARSIQEGLIIKKRRSRTA